MRRLANRHAVLRVFVVWVVTALTLFTLSALIPEIRHPELGLCLRYRGRDRPPQRRDVAAVRQVRAAYHGVLSSQSSPAFNLSSFCRARCALSAARTRWDARQS
jgi:hypothetical protein